MLKIIIVILMAINLTSCVGYSVLSEINASFNKYDAKDKSGILKILGKPAKIEFMNGKENWIYNDNLSFRGIVIGLIIPLPLIIPTGFNKTIFEFENDVLCNTTIQHTGTSPEHWCGFIPTGESIYFGCYSK